MIVLMRHGESPVNVTRTLSCRHVDPPLTESGVKQVGQAVAWLAGRPIRRLYASPLRRAVQTAQVAGQRLGLDPTIAEELREIDCGVLEGRSDREAWESFRQVVFRWFAGDRDVGFDAGETGHQAAQRFARFMRSLPAEDGDALVVGHGGIFAFGLFSVCRDFYLPDPRDFYLPVTGIALVDRTPDGFSCVKWGLSEHLDQPSIVDVPKDFLG